MNCCLAILESDPEAWASQHSYSQETGSSGDGTQALSLYSPESEFDGAEWLEEAVQAGVI